MTDTRGAYKVGDLPPGVYRIEFFYAGRTAQKSDVVVSAFRTTSGHGWIDMTRTIGGEVILLEGSAPGIDPASTTQGVHVDRAYFDSVPFPGQSFAGALQLAPGARSDGRGISFAGSSSLENLYTLDGLNTTELLTGGIGTPLLTDFVHEMEVLSGGYNAEYGRSTGGSINLVTKRGTNQFHGSVFSYVSPGFLHAPEKDKPIQSGPIQSESDDVYRSDIGFDLGGPIVRDRLWFYVGFAPRFARTHIDKVTKSRVDNDQDGVPDVDTDSGLLVFEEIDRQRANQDRYGFQGVAKLNLAIDAAHQGQLSFIAIPDVAESIEVNGEPGALHKKQKTLVTDLVGTWTSKFHRNKTTLEAVFGLHRFSSKADSVDKQAQELPQQILRGGSLGVERDGIRIGLDATSMRRWRTRRLVSSDR